MIDTIGVVKIPEAARVDHLDFRVPKSCLL